MLDYLLLLGCLLGAGLADNPAPEKRAALCRVLSEPRPDYPGDDWMAYLRAQGYTVYPGGYASTGNPRRISSTLIVPPRHVMQWAGPNPYPPVMPMPAGPRD